jgi:nucleosome assembly protein 1-like 1
MIFSVKTAALKKTSLCRACSLVFAAFGGGGGQSSHVEAMIHDGQCDVQMLEKANMSDGESSGGEVYFNIDSLPKVVQNRVKVLKNLQFETVKTEADYHREVHVLDLKYQARYDEINRKRTAVISGQHEPTGAEIEWPDKAKPKEEDLSGAVEKIKITDLDENTKGIPKFWLYVLKNANAEALMGLIEPHDEPVLEFLTDITVALSQPDNSSFTLHFEFGPNPFFSNTTLTKTYTLRENPSRDSPMEYDGPEIIRCKGCTIDWKAGKDVTKRTVTIKKQKAKKGAKGSPEKKVTKEVRIDSFFNFFSPPDVPDGEMREEDAATLALDFDVGFAIKEKVIPRAVLYFTGEAFEDDDEDYDECEGEEDDEDTEEDDGGDQ